jgi:hypothetical protein
MKPIKEPINIYEVVVTETRAVTYLVHAKSSGGATAKAVHHWGNCGSEDIKEIKSDRYEYDVESVECVERNIYDES